MTVVRYEWLGIDNMIEEIDRVVLRDEPYRITGPLNAVLHEAFLDTQARVASPMHPHVPTYAPTGRLQASGRTDQSFNGNIWVGTITYGGRSRDVVYAIYEMARGGVHDWFSGLPAFGPRYLDAIHNHYRGGI
jgi:hypothetical protein